MWQAIIPAAISAAGNFLSSRSAASQSAEAARATNEAELAFARELNRNKIQWTVADAKAAGIHPLAALGSSVSGSWATPSFTVPSHFAGDALGAGLSAIGDAGSRLYEQDAERDERSEQRRHESDMEDRRRTADGAERAFRLRVHQDQQALARKQMLYLDAQIAETVSRTLLNKSRAAALGGPGSTPNPELEVPKGELPRSVPLRLGGPETFHTGKTSRQQYVEDEYGGIVGEVYGLGRFLQDLWSNVTR